MGDAQQNRSAIRAALLAWYDANARSLPCRETRDPYRVWLSEVMLQQTTVAHATAYFHAFVARWPTVEALAAAEDGAVMGAWAGLGYYARARNLLACARAVVTTGGRFADDEAALRRPPGVGAYTAAAIAAIAFDRPANVVDGNIERVMARLYAVETPLPGARAALSALAGRLVAPERAGDWPQALMDLGATVCGPRNPACGACPLAPFCRARMTGAPENFPRRSARAERPTRRGAAFVLTREAEVALVRRPPAGLLGGMLGLPTTDWRPAPWPREEALAQAPAHGAGWRDAGAVAHVFTHFSLELTVFAAPASALADYQWMDVNEALATTPTLFRKALAMARETGRG
ncbi:MAG: A/G-specific adenine glycosylase [Caulobacteraceae bacterium]